MTNPAKGGRHRATRVPAHVKAALRGETKEPQLAELASHFFAAAGGPKEVAIILYTEFRRAPPGSLARQRILDMILRATRFANERSQRVDDYGLLSDEDLERELETLIAEMPVGDAQEEATAGPEQAGAARAEAPGGPALPAGVPHAPGEVPARPGPGGAGGDAGGGPGG